MFITIMGCSTAKTSLGAILNTGAVKDVPAILTETGTAVRLEPFGAARLAVCDLLMLQCQSTVVHSLPSEQVSVGMATS